MGVSKKGRTDVNEERYGQKNNPDVLENFLRWKLESRGVDLQGVHFASRPGSNHSRKVIVDALRGDKWIASANVNRYGEIKYSMPGTDRK